MRRTWLLGCVIAFSVWSAPMREAFGSIDNTTRERIKEELRELGLFRNENYAWSMSHSKEECDAEREMSEKILEARLASLAEENEHNVRTDIPISSLEMDDTIWPTSVACPFCGGSSAVPSGLWCENWTKPVFVTVYYVDARGNRLGTVQLMINAKDAKGRIAVRAVIQDAGRQSCVVESKYCKIDADGNLRVKGLGVKNLGTFNLIITQEGLVSGTIGGYKAGNNVASLLPDDGGVEFEHGEHVFRVEVGAYVLKAKNYTLIEETIPQEVRIVTSEKKWNCGKASTPKYKKRYNEDGTVVYELVGLNDGNAPNVSKLTLKFNAKQNTFKGSFKVYATNEGAVRPGRKPSLKQYTFTVKGQVGSTGLIGTATCKTLKASWSVSIE